MRKRSLDVAFRRGLDAFDDGGDPHATSDAECDQCVASARAVEFVDGVSDQHGAGRAEWVAHRDGPTIDVELFVGNMELALRAEDDGGEGFVNFPHVDIVGSETGLVECGTCSGCGGGQHDGGFDAGSRGGYDASARREPHVRTSLFRADEGHGGAVDNARGIACVMNVVDVLNLRVPGQRGGVKTAYPPHFGERRLEPGERFDSSVGAYGFVLIEKLETVLIRDGTMELEKRPSSHA